MKIIFRILAFIVVTCTTEASAQSEANKMNIRFLSQTESRVKIQGNNIPLIDSRGLVAGSYTTYAKGDEVFYKIAPDEGKEMELKALKGFHYLKNEAVIMYGAPFYDCVSHEMELIVYDMEGNKKAEYSEKLHSPFSVVPGVKSDLFVSGKKVGAENESSCVLRRLGTNLSKVWELNLTGGFIQYMKVSPSGEFLLAVLYEYDKHDIRTLLIDASNGKILSEVQNLNTILNAEFIGSDTLAIAGATHFNMYTVSKVKGLSLLRSVDIPINTVSMGFSISVNTERNIVAVAHCSDRSETESQITFYDLRSGEILNKIYLPGDRSIRMYRILQFTSNDSFEILTNDYTYTYEYAY